MLRHRSTYHKIRNPLFSEYTLHEIRSKKTYHTYCFDDLLPKLKHGYTYEIHLLKKGKTLTSWDYILNNIGDSPIIPTSRGIKLSFFKNRLLRSEFKHIQFICNKMQQIKANIDVNVHKLIKSNNHLKQVLKYGNKYDLLYLWSQIIKINEWNKQRSALKNIKKYILLSYGSLHMRRPFIIYQFNKILDIYNFKKICKIITSKCLRRDIADSINEQFSIIPSKGKSIADILVNIKKISRNPKFECAGKPWCRDDTHFTKDLSEMKGLCKKIGQLNARFVPLDNNDYYINSINGYVKSYSINLDFLLLTHPGKTTIIRILLSL